MAGFIINPWVDVWPLELTRQRVWVVSNREYWKMAWVMAILLCPETKAGMFHIGIDDSEPT